MREAEIKASLIDALFNAGLVDAESVVITELPVKSWTRRADVVLANGRIQGFEIKSQFDTIDRLEGQLAAYRDALEGVSVVTSEKHLEGVLRMAGNDVGVFLLNEGEGGEQPTIKQLQKPKFKLLSPRAAIRLMLVSDLRCLLKSCNINIPHSRGRQFLEEEALKLPLPIVREAAIKSIKNRYGKYHRQFISKRRYGASTLNALDCFKRPTWGNPKNIKGNLVNKPSSTLPPVVDSKESKTDKISLMAIPRRVAG